VVHHNKGWQTSGSVRVVRLAFNLYTDGTPSVNNYKRKDEQIDECRRYSVSDIFCCGYAMYFWQGIKLWTGGRYEKIPYRIILWNYPTGCAIIFTVRLEQRGIVCGCPFWKQKGGRYEYIRDTYIIVSHFCSISILRQ